jgi:DNA polymerase-3 subunit alpha
MSTTVLAPGWASLHNHTSHSVLDGAARISDIAEAARAQADIDGNNEPALGISDHGTLSGVRKFADACRKWGVKPAMGLELYLSIGSRFEKNTIESFTDDGVDAAVGEGDNPTARKKTKRYEHITVFAQNAKGWENLVRINNAAQTEESTWYKPRADLDLLCQYSEGLIVFTGCLGGPIAGSLMRGDTRRANAVMRQLCAAFDRDHLFVEVMEHGIEIEKAIMPGLLGLAEKYDRRVVATNDAHYVNEDDHLVHEAWLCAGVKKKMSDTNRFRFNGTGYHLRTAAQMHELFDRQPGTEDAVSNTLLVTSTIDPDVLGLDSDHLRIPEFPLPDGYEPSQQARNKGLSGSAALLWDQVIKGARVRYPALPDEVKERLRFEFDVIYSMGLHNYFLIVQDLVDWARSEGIRVGPGRGSAAGCAISYCLGIVNVEPIANGLLFERFLNPERVGMPDIDLDFEAQHRPRVYDYLVARWGADRVARIGSFGYSLTKASLKAAGRVLDNYDAGEKLSAAVPKDKGGKPMKLSRLVDATNPLDPETVAGEEFRRRVAESPEFQEVVALARGFEGIIDKEGVHACGIVVSDESLEGIMPYRFSKDGQKVTQWDGVDVDAANFLKIDALALRNLDIITACERLIFETTGERLDADNPPVDPTDPTLTDEDRRRIAAAWAIIAEGRTAGLFQLESSGMTQLCIDIAAENLNDLSAIVALFRPGPLGEDMHIRYAERKHGREPVDYGIFTSGSPNEAAEQKVIAAVLDETYGVPCYQEQLMEIGEVVAAFDPAGKNRIRKAISKKKKDEMAAVGEQFVAGAMTEIRDESGNITKIAFAEQTAIRLWDAMKSAGDYSFNKAHSFAYGWLGYITAFLKATWPAEYGAALLSVTDKGDKRLGVLTSLRDEGIEVLAPSINLASITTGVDDLGRVIMGLGEVKDVAAADAELIVQARDEGGLFVSMDDFVARTTQVTVKAPEDTAPDGRVIPAKITKKSLVGSKSVEALIEAGAFDEFAPLDPGGRACRKALTFCARAQSAPERIAPPVMEWGDLERARRERHRLGVLISESPLRNHVAAIKDASILGHRPTSLRSVASDTEPGLVTTVGVVAAWDEKAGHWGTRASITLEGTGAWMAGMAWNRTVNETRANGQIPNLGDAVIVRGMRKLRKVRTDDMNDGAEGAVMADERPELTFYDIALLPIDDAGLRPVRTGPTRCFRRPEGYVDPVPDPDPTPDGPGGGEPPSQGSLLDLIADDEPLIEPAPDDRPEDDAEEIAALLDDEPLVEVAVRFEIPFDDDLADALAEEGPGQPPSRPGLTLVPAPEQQPTSEPVPEPAPEPEPVPERAYTAADGAPPDRSTLVQGFPVAAWFDDSDAVIELPWDGTNAHVDQVIIEIDPANTADWLGCARALFTTRPEVERIVKGVDDLTGGRIRKLNGDEYADVIRALVDDGTPVRRDDLAASPPRSTWIVRATPVPGEAAAAFADGLTATLLADPACEPAEQAA